jgi:hypothetical protein
MDDPHDHRRRRPAPAQRSRPIPRLAELAATLALGTAVLTGCGRPLCVEPHDDDDGAAATRGATAGIWALIRRPFTCDRPPGATSTTVDTAHMTAGVPVPVQTTPVEPLPSVPTSEIAAPGQMIAVTDDPRVVRPAPTPRRPPRTTHVAPRRAR